MDYEALDNTRKGSLFPEDVQRWIRGFCEREAPAAQIMAKPKGKLSATAVAQKLLNGWLQERLDGEILPITEATSVAADLSPAERTALLHAQAAHRGKSVGSLGGSVVVELLQEKQLIRLRDDPDEGYALSFDGHRVSQALLRLLRLSAEAERQRRVKDADQ